MRRLALLSAIAALSSSSEVLKDFHPAPSATAYGAVSYVEFASAMIALEPQMLAAHLPQAMKEFTFEEPVWLVAYKTEILDTQGKAPKENFLCHTFFGDQRVTQSEDQEMRGLYTDAFTPYVRLPEGFGVRIAAGEGIHWMPMFNNRGDAAANVRMKFRLSVIRERDLRKPLTPLYATLRSVTVPHLYFVKPGGETRGATFQMDFNGKIHFMGTHIHPYGLRVELFNISKNELVWRGVRKTNGPAAQMEMYSDPQGYSVKAGEIYRVVAAYENPTKAPVDAMGGLYILYSRK